MELKRITIAAAAAILAVSGIGSIFVLQGQPAPVQAIDLTDDDRDPAIRRDEDDGTALESVDDDDDDATDDDATDNDATDDGTSGGNNTGDGDDTRGDDGTSGGNNTGDEIGRASCRERE